MRNHTFCNLQQSRSGDSFSEDRSDALALYINRDSLRELVSEVIHRLPSVNFPEGRIALTEDEAAKACGVAGHVLRDLRLTGQIKARKLGRRVVYTQADLLSALNVLTPPS